MLVAETGLRMDVWFSSSYTSFSYFLNFYENSDRLSMKDVSKVFIWNIRKEKKGKERKGKVKNGHYHESSWLQVEKRKYKRERSVGVQISVWLEKSSKKLIAFLLGLEDGAIQFSSVKRLKEDKEEK